MSAGGGTVRTVPLTMQHQKLSEWCWAAVSVSVNLYFRPDSTHTQCEIAGSVLNVACCGQGTETEARCNASHELHPVLGRLHLLAADPVLKPLTFDQIQKQIDAGHPICVLIKWLDHEGNVTDRGHFIAVAGYRITAAQKQFVSIADPLYGPSEVSYVEFSSHKGGYRDGSGVWFASFLVENEAAS